LASALTPQNAPFPFFAPLCSVLFARRAISILEVAPGDLFLGTTDDVHVPRFPAFGRLAFVRFAKGARASFVLVGFSHRQDIF
jgi:hypothetical protein